MRREKQIIDAAVTSAAMAGEGHTKPKRWRKAPAPHQIVPTITTEAAVAAAEQFVEMWTQGSTQVARILGRPFPLRLERASAFEVRFRGGTEAANTARGMLLGLSTVLPDDQLLRWMLDLMFVAELPEDRIKAEAGGRGSLWDRKLRHTKRGKEALAERDFRERLAEGVERGAEANPPAFDLEMYDKNEIERNADSAIARSGKAPWLFNPPKG
jgi:hypothetical protein